MTDQIESIEPAQRPAQKSKLDFLETPAEFLAFFSENVKLGKSGGGIDLYPWQHEILENLGKVKPTDKHPFKFCLCAANGSGKDAFVIAPFAVWFICCKVDALVIITSSSGVQLSNQTEKYIRNLAQKVNVWSLGLFGQEILKINQRKISCGLSGSEILLFATDEGAKAEGYHPIEANSEMAIIVNEAKSVKPEIFDALKRCTGFNYWLNVSSPGEPIGYFYDTWMTWENKRRVTYYDILDHASKEMFEEDQKLMGEHSFLFRSKWLAEFTFVGGKYVIDQTKLHNLRQRTKDGFIKPILQEQTMKIGIDVALSTNGDETVISAFKGNVQKALITYRVKDATVLSENIDKDLREKLKIKRDHPFIFIDDGNVGRAVADILRRMGWIGIHRVLFQSPAKNKQFRNRGAELWCKFAKLVEYGIPILLDDDKLYSQIASRKFKESIAGIDKLTLEAKGDMFKHGLPSPDRADASVLAFTDCNINDFIDKHELSYESLEKAVKRTWEEEAADLQRQIGGLYVMKGRAGNSHGSLNVLVGKQTINRRMLKWTKNQTT